MKKIKPNFLIDKIAFFHDSFKQNSNASIAAGSLVYQLFKPFVPEERQEQLTRLQEYNYKAMERCNIDPRGLLIKTSYSEFLFDFSLWLSKSDSYKSKHRIFMRMDSSDTGDHYGEQIPCIKKLYDYCKQYYKLTHKILVLMISIGKKDYVVDFFVLARDNKDDVNTFRRMLHELKLRLGKLHKDFQYYCRLSLDGHYGKGEYLKTMMDEGFTHNAVKSGGLDICYCNGKEYTLKELENHLISEGNFKDFNSCHGLKKCQYKECTITLYSSKLKLKVILLKYPGRKKHRYLMLLSLNLDWYAYQIVQCYKGRWQIEVLFKKCKGNYGLSKYSYHTKKDGLKNEQKTKTALEKISYHLSFGLINYMLINWYRAQYTKMKLTKAKTVINEIRKYFGSLHTKALLNLFSAYG
jgi:hypothetical protein